MRALLLILALLLAACNPEAEPEAAASVPTLGTAEAGTPRTYTLADRRTFCETIASEAFVRDHFEMEPGTAVRQTVNPGSCTGHWGAEAFGAPEATHYAFDHMITMNEATAQRAYLELADAEGVTDADAIAGLGDEAAFVRDGYNPTIMVRVGNVVLHHIQTYPNAWGEEDVSAYSGPIEERGEALARALAERL